MEGNGTGTFTHNTHPRPMQLVFTCSVQFFADRLGLSICLPRTLLLFGSSLRSINSRAIMGIMELHFLLPEFRCIATDGSGTATFKYFVAKVKAPINASPVTTDRPPSPCTVMWSERRGYPAGLAWRFSTLPHPWLFNPLINPYTPYIYTCNYHRQ